MIKEISPNLEPLIGGRPDTLRRARPQLELSPAIQPISADEVLSHGLAENLAELRERLWPHGDADLFLASVVHAARGLQDWETFERELGLQVPPGLRGALDGLCTLSELPPRGAVVPAVLGFGRPMRLYIPCLLDSMHDFGGLWGFPESTRRAATSTAASLAAHCAAA